MRRTCKLHAELQFGEVMRGLVLPNVDPLVRVQHEAVVSFEIVLTERPHFIDLEISRSNRTAEQPRNLSALIAVRVAHANDLGLARGRVQQLPELVRVLGRLAALFNHVRIELHVLGQVLRVVVLVVVRQLAAPDEEVFAVQQDKARGTRQGTCGAVNFYCTDIAWRTATHLEQLRFYARTLGSHITKSNLSV